MVSAHLGGWCRRGVPVVLWVLEATRRRSCGRREPREGCQSRRGACEGTEGRGRGVDSTSRVRGPPGRPCLLVWDQTLIALRLSLVLENCGGVRAAARQWSLSGGRSPDSLCCSAPGILVEFFSSCHEFSLGFLLLIPCSSQMVLTCIGNVMLLLGSLSAADSRRPMCSVDGLLGHRLPSSDNTEYCVPLASLAMIASTPPDA